MKVLVIECTTGAPFGHLADFAKNVGAGIVLDEITEDEGRDLVVFLWHKETNELNPADHEYLTWSAWVRDYHIVDIAPPYDPWKVDEALKAKANEARIIEYTNDRGAAVFYTGDCREVLPRFKDGQFQMALFSSPYPGQRGFDVSAPEYLDRWLPSVLRELLRKIDPVTGVIVQNIAFKRRKVKGFKYALPDPRIYEIISIYESFGLYYINPYMWDKLNAPPSGNIDKFDHSGFEYCFTFAFSDQFTFNPQREEYSQKWINKSKNDKPRGEDVAGSMAGGHAILHKDGARQPNIIKASSSGDQNRPRAKGGSFPRALANRFIMTFSDPGDSIIDPFCGVGTSNYESFRNGRPSVGIDIEQDNINAAVDWLRLLP